MKTILRIFKHDIKQIFSNVVTVIIVLGLVLLPSIFSWYNVLACWDVFNNTDNLKVAVANSDEGYQSDLVPLKVNLGDQVQNALLEDKEMEWVFTSEEDAIEGARSGEYYAAVVIPQSFSKDMMTFYSPEVEHASILYYTNEKKNVVAPKLTERGADDVANKINTIFVEKVSEVGLNVASSLVDYTDNKQFVNQITQLSDNIATLSGRMAQASEVVSGYSSLLSASESLIASSADLLGETSDSAQQVLDTTNNAKQSINSLTDAMAVSTDALHSALEKSTDSFEGVSESIDTAFTSSGTAATTTASSLDTQAEAVRNQAVSMRAMADSLERCSVPPEFEGTLDAFVSQVRASADTQDQLAQSLTAAADSIRTQNDEAQAHHAEVKDLAEQAKGSIKDLSQDYNNTIKPELEKLQTQVEKSSTLLFDNASQLSSVTEGINGASGSLIDTLAVAQNNLDSSAQSLKESSEYLAQLSSNIKTAVSSEDWQGLKQIFQTDPHELAQSLASPVQIERTALYPASNFGSQMAPLYTMLGLWIGSLLLLVAVKVKVSSRTLAEVGYPKLHQVFWGRFLIFACLSFVQSSILALGNLLFLQVQATEPLLFLVCYWVSGLVFTFIIYTLVVSFANLGKALAVFLLIIQVSAGGGSYPLPMLPDFVQALSPFLPLTHAINALRAAMMGLYQMDFWVEIGLLLVFVVPFMLLGLLLRKPLMNLLNWYVRKTEESKLIS